MELEAIGAKMEEEDKAISLLFSLPLSYEHFCTTLMHRKDTLGLDEVIGTLLSCKLMGRKESERVLKEHVTVASFDSQAIGQTSRSKMGQSQGGGHTY